MADYGLVLQADAARQAQTARIVEQAGLSAILARSTEQAAFHVARLGPPALLLVDLAYPAERELQFLRDLRRTMPSKSIPVIAIVQSKQMYEVAARLMIELGIVSLLAQPRQMQPIETAVQRALGATTFSQPPPSRPKSGPITVPPAAAAKKPDEPRRDGYVEALRVAERLSDHPLVEQLAQLKVLEAGFSQEELQRLIGETATAFRAAIAIVWLEERFATHPPELAGEAESWGAFRNALADAPLHVMDAARHRLTAKNPKVRDGVVRCFAGSPIRSSDGAVSGAIFLADPRVGGILPDMLDALVFWALRIGSALPARPPEPERKATPPAGSGAPVTPAEAPPSLRVMLGALHSGILITGADDRVMFANARASELLGVPKLRGMARSELLLGLGADPQAGEIRLWEPVRRVLRWESDKQGENRIDELTDLTLQVLQREELEKLVRIDPLTELPNRRGAEEVLAREISRSLRAGGPLSVAMFEIDSLSVYEDAMARLVLRTTSWILRDAVRGYDFAARWDPQQLIAILPGAANSQAFVFAERFRAAVEGTVVEGQPRVTVSGGVAEFDKTKAADQLLADAHAALIEARRQGGNTIL